MVICVIAKTKIDTYQKFFDNYKIYDLNTKHEYSEESDRITINFRVSIAYIGIKKDYNDYIIRQINLYIYLKKKAEMHIHIFNKYNF